MENIYILKEDVLSKYQTLQENLSIKEKKAFHFKSLDNFIYYIFSDNEINNNKSKLNEIKLYETQKKVLEYINLISQNEVTVNDSEYLFKKHINVMGAFMSEKYGFIFAAGKIRYFYIFTDIIIGVVLDIIVSLILKRTFFFFSIA